MNSSSLEDFMLYEGCVVANPPDGDLGDGPQRTAMAHIGLFLGGCSDHRDSFAAARQLLADANGRLIRDPVRWNDPNDISRDQEEPWIIACALYGFDQDARRLIFRRWRRFGKYANADWMNPCSLATDFRALGWRFGYPLILFGDLWATFGALIDIVKARWHRNKDGPWLDMDNAVTRLSYYRSRYPTPLAWLARKLYLWLFPDNVGGRGIRGAVLNKHREGVGNPEMGRLWEKITDRW